MFYYLGVIYLICVGIVTVVLSVLICLDIKDKKTFHIEDVGTCIAMLLAGPGMLVVMIVFAIREGMDNIKIRNMRW